MYILTDEPKGPSVLMTEAFTSLDNAFGTEEFTRAEAIHAIANTMDRGTTGAESLFMDLEARGCVTQVS